MSEPNAGSDVVSMKLKAEKKGEAPLDLGASGMGAEMDRGTAFLRVREQSLGVASARFPELFPSGAAFCSAAGPQTDWLGQGQHDLSKYQLLVLRRSLHPEREQVLDYQRP